MHSGSSRTAVADKTKVIVGHRLLHSGWHQSLAGHLYVTHRHYLGCAEASPAFSGFLAAGRTSAQHKAFPAVWHLGQDEGGSGASIREARLWRSSGSVPCRQRQEKSETLPPFDQDQAGTSCLIYSLQGNFIRGICHARKSAATFTRTA